MGTKTEVWDGNTAAASVAYRTNEVLAIYPITPSSTMGELADEWAAKDKANIWGTIPRVVEMQSEAGAAGAVHGALQAGSLASTFTASQGLLLMIPNMYKIAGELLPFTMHVAARSVATHALSIFGDHSDVMACRQTGFAMIAAASVQEAHDMACVAQMATLASRVPFLHFFDGFRTSHELNEVTPLSDDDLRSLIDDGAVSGHRGRSLSPDRPVLRGTAQNPDAFFQAREACNPFHEAVTGIVEETLERFAARTGRRYRLVEYEGAADADRVVVLMGSGAETAAETVRSLAERGEKVGALTVRLYRPFPVERFLAALPSTVRSIAVLDRTKEPGAPAEPLLLDVLAALDEGRANGRTDLPLPGRVVGGRYGLSSKEFTPRMVKAVLDEISKEKPRRRFTVGIVDDVTHLSLALDDLFDLDTTGATGALFFGLGADGTVSANKSTIKILSEGTALHAQGYFVYDSKKSGSVTVSHLRFGPRPIHAAYLLDRASFVACHQSSLLDQYDMLEAAAPGGTFLLNSAYGAGEVWGQLPREMQQQILDKKLKFYVIDAYGLAREVGLGGRINTIMQTCFFALSGLLPEEQAIAKIKDSIRVAYGKRGEAEVEKNVAAVDAALARLETVPTRDLVADGHPRPPVVSDKAPDFVKRVTAVLLAGKGDLLPVSAFPPDGTWPMGTAKWEKRNIAAEIPVWDAALCIQCNKCTMVCPHAAIRANVYPEASLAGAPPTFKSVPYKADDFKGMPFTIQVAAEDCTGCTLCRVVCPAKDRSNPRHKALDMAPQAPLREAERANYEFFLALPQPDRTALRMDVKGTQFLEPLFEYSGACSGCGETPYIKLMTQLFGDRALIANATGCSSIYGGNLPTTPYTTNRDGRGPAWANSLFEDNAEFGLGFRLALDKRRDVARDLVTKLSAPLGGVLADELLAGTSGRTEVEVGAQRARVAELKRRLGSIDTGYSRTLAVLADDLVHKSVWIVGGDGWAYDIGYGGLDHVLSLGEDVNILVLDTEVYSNTGGQQSKATPRAASAKFAIAGKAIPKKDLGLMAMAYGGAYVARVAFGAGTKDVQTVKAFLEAEAFPGPSIIIAYSPCIAHGYDMAQQLSQQQKAVASGYWPLYRFDPRRTPEEGTLILDSGPVKEDIGVFMRNETRFRMVEQRDPDRFRMLLSTARAEATEKLNALGRLAAKPEAK